MSICQSPIFKVDERRSSFPKQTLEMRYGQAWGSLTSAPCYRSFCQVMPAVSIQSISQLWRYFQTSMLQAQSNKQMAAAPLIVAHDFLWLRSFLAHIARLWVWQAVLPLPLQSVCEERRQRLGAKTFTSSFRLWYVILPRLRFRKLEMLKNTIDHQPRTRLSSKTRNAPSLVAKWTNPLGSKRSKSKWGFFLTALLSSPWSLRWLPGGFVPVDKGDKTPLREEVANLALSYIKCQIKSTSPTASLSITSKSKPPLHHLYHWCHPRRPDMQYASERNEESKSGATKGIHHESHTLHGSESLKRESSLSSSWRLQASLLCFKENSNPNANCKPNCFVLD